ncbi:MAG: type II secretion system major pseudopilin GspG [Myxococcota bacterium]
MKRTRRTMMRAAERGVTLVEIMVVVVIIALVAGIAGVQVFGVLGGAQDSAAWTQMKNIQDSLDIYKLQNRKYPSTAEGLQALTQAKNGREPLMKQVPKDPWGNDFVYVYPGQQNQGGVDLLSYGADGTPGNGDDICSWKSQDDQPCG